MRIEIESRTVSSSRLYSLLKNTNIHHVEFQHMNEMKHRGTDASFVVAIISASGIILTALITGMLKILEQAKAGKIIITGKSGRKIELPADANHDQIAAAVEAAKELDIERIILTR